MDPEPYIIETNNLTKKFGKFIAVDNITFNVRRGEIFGFLGANGAGKTTAIKMFTGLHAPTSGIAKVAGYDVYKETEKIKKNIGYMSQKFSLYEDLTVEENIKFYGGIYGLKMKDLKKKAHDILIRLDMEEHAKSLISSIPLGWKQKLAFSVALIHEPAILFLDEPTGGVDPITRRKFWEMIYETASKGTTVFVTTHYMDEAEYCDRISIMVAGKIVALGTPGELKSEHSSGNMNEVFIKLARKGDEEE
jgi:ABC-2 type transport system ATP-binding protein